MGNHDYWEEIENKLIQEVTTCLSSSDGFDVNRTDEFGISLLHISAQKGMLKLCKILLQNNADVNITDIYERTPLMTASYFGHKTIVELLVEKGASSTQVDIYGFSSVMYAVYSGGIDVFKLSFPQQGCETFQETFLGQMSPLALASSIGKTDIGNFIISQNPELVNSVVTKSGMSPLMLAICGAHSDMVDILLENKASLHSKSNFELTSIGYAKAFSFPLLKLKIPLINMPEDGDCDFSPKKRRAHPLTPNIYISPIKKLASPKQCINWIKMTIKPKRSRSLDKRSNEKHEDKEEDNVLKSILEFAKLEEFWTLFKEQEINFNTFLTMDDEDLSAIGISKTSIRLKLLNLIDHYRKIFYSK